MTMTTSRFTSNPYLAGNFAPVREEHDVSDLPVTGAIPPEIGGLLLRNGPNPVLDPDLTAYHWFLGDGMLHGVELSGGRARHRNRWVRTAAACAALGEPAPAGPPEVNGIHSVANTSVVAHAGRIYALVESSLPTQVRPDLSTIGASDLGGRLASPFTAHPKIDPSTQEMLAFGYDMFTEPFLRYHVLDPNGSLVRTSAIDIPRPVLMHTFSVTATRVVWLDLPLVFELDLVGRQPMPFTWRPEHGARVGIMSRVGESAPIMWIDIEPCYVFHDLNAFDDADGNVVLDVVVYPDMFLTDLYGTGASSPPTLERWTIDTAASHIRRETLDDAAQDFPRINDGYRGRRHRYGYTTDAQINASTVGLGGLRKHDVVKGTVEHHDVGHGNGASEPVFIPTRDDSGEDAGWVVSVVFDAQRQASDVVLLDATAFESPPVATIHLPYRVPFGFHGSWLPGIGLGD